MSYQTQPTYNVSEAYRGLRALTDCGALCSFKRQPLHLKAAVEAGWARARSHWLGDRYYHVYTLKIERGRAINMLATR